MPCVTIDMMKGPEYRDLAWSLWSGCGVNADIDQGLVISLIIQQITIVEKDIVHISGVTEKSQEYFEGYINVNPHSPRYKCGELTLRI